MKVCIVGPDSIHVHRFYENLKGKDIDFQLIAETKVSWFEGKQFQFSFRANNALELWKKYISIRKILRAEAPQLIHIHQINRLALMVGKAAQKEGIKVIATAWGSDVLLVPKRNKIYAWLTKKTLQYAALITADSANVIESMRQLYPKGNYHSWQYGIDAISSNVPKENIIYSNRMHEPLYRIESIITYFAEFYKTHTDWKLVVAANGSLTENLKAKAKELNLSEWVDFVGFCDAKQNAEFYSKAAIYISIPESDGTSVSLMEAMSAACIPIVSDLEVNHHWIRDNENGIIEKVGENPLFLALKLENKEVKEINQKMTAAISREKMGDEMMAFYRQLTQRHSS